MDLDQIELKKTGILFFDMLNCFYHHAGEEVKARKKTMVENAVRLMKTGREARIPIFFAKGNHRADNTTSVLTLTDTDITLKPWPNGVATLVRPPAVEGESGSEVIPELDPRDTDYYIPKYRWSAFYETYLDLALRAMGIDTIIISGASTDVGIASTVFFGREMDYNMIIVRDACATVHDQQAHEVLMDLIFPRMCRVRTTEQALQMIRKGLGT
jgi:nicotinamidase-related amidase